MVGEWGKLLFSSKKKKKEKKKRKKENQRRIYFQETAFALQTLVEPGDLGPDLSIMNHLIPHWNT